MSHPPNYYCGKKERRGKYDAYQHVYKKVGHLFYVVNYFAFERI